MRSHDKIGFRLSRILTRLNGGARLSIDELAEEFNVNKRTILRLRATKYLAHPKRKRQVFFRGVRSW